MVATMRAQPGFKEAVAHALRGICREGDADTEFESLMPDMESLVLGMLALYLDATGGLTHRRLRDIAGVPGILSGGRISALLLRMRIIGFVTADAAHLEGVPKVYRPTPRMRSAFQTRVRCVLQALQQMAPEPRDLLDRVEDPEGFRAYMAALGRVSLERVFEPTAAIGPEPRTAISELGTRRAGHAILFNLLDAASLGAPTLPARARVKISISALASRRHVSRTQVARVLRLAEAGGLLVRGEAGDEGEGEVRPPLLDGVEDTFARIFIAMAASAGIALVEASPERAAAGIGNAPADPSP